MVEEADRSLVAVFAALPDPQQVGKVLYPVPEIMVLLLCATLAGADDCVEIALWGRRTLAFLRRLLPYQQGIPSHNWARWSPLSILGCSGTASPPGSPGCGRRHRPIRRSGR